MKRNCSEEYKKPLRRNKSDFASLANEKNKEIIELRGKNFELTRQVYKLTKVAKKYKKLKNSYNEKVLEIKILRGTTGSKKTSTLRTETGDSHNIKKNSSSKLKNFKTKLRICSRISIDNLSKNSGIMSCRPKTSANYNKSLKTSPPRSKNRISSKHFSPSMASLLAKTKRILKGWKKAYKKSIKDKL